MNKKMVIKDAQYTLLVYKLVDYFKTITVNKCVFLTFCVKNCMSGGDNVGRLKYNVFEEVLKRFRSKFLLYKEDFLTIITSMDILVKTGYILLEGNKIKITNKKIKDLEPFELKHEKLFEEAKKMNEVWFMEEIISHV